jgi:hypothetical protein
VKRKHPEAAAAASPEPDTSTTTTVAPPLPLPPLEDILLAPVVAEQPLSRGALPQDINADLIQSSSSFDPPPSGSSFSSIYVDVSAPTELFTHHLTTFIPAACLWLNSVPQSSPEDAFGINLLPLEQNPSSNTVAPDALGRESSPQSQP